MESHWKDVHKEETLAALYFDGIAEGGFKWKRGDQMGGDPLSKGEALGTCTGVAEMKELRCIKILGIFWR